jgi:branched-subunit amino acid transport protein
MSPELLMILGMTAVTVLPRILPALLPARLTLPRPLARWLEQVPYAALGALIFPGILSADPTSVWPGAAGAAAALTASLLRAPAFVAALAAVLAAAAVMTFA